MHISQGFLKSYKTLKIGWHNISGQEIVSSFCCAKAPHIFWAKKKKKKKRVFAYNMFEKLLYHDNMLPCRALKRQTLIYSVVTLEQLGLEE